MIIAEQDVVLSRDGTNGYQRFGVKCLSGILSASMAPGREPEGHRRKRGMKTLSQGNAHGT